MRTSNDSLDLDGTNMAVDITSDPVWLQNIVNYNLQLVFTGSPVGSFKLQISNDLGNPQAVEQQNQDFQIVNWTDMKDSNQAISAAGNHSYEVQNAGHRWVRLIYTATSGSGTLTSSRFNAKGF